MQDVRVQGTWLMGNKNRLTGMLAQLAISLAATQSRILVQLVLRAN